jgi:subtilisin family serine protease
MNKQINRFLITTIVTMAGLGQCFAQSTDLRRGDWFNSNYAEDAQLGALVDRAYLSFLSDKQPQEVIVAIIDSGVDIAHEDLQDALWVNEGEIEGNGIDDDGNGYVDDVHGWSFISGPNGDVHYDNLEFTRVYADLANRFKGKVKADVRRAERDDYKRFLSFERKYNDRVAKAKNELNEFEQVAEFYYFARKQMNEVFGTETYTIEDVRSLESEDEMSIMLRDFMIFALENDFESELEEGLAHFRNTLIYSYNTTLDTRTIVGDDYDNLEERQYGTHRVTGPSAEHGTHVAGIVAAIRGNGLGIDGVASAAKIMVLRAVPDGDERDKDVANAIRYAVDNGARIINMSFGKSYSPHKELVDEAVRYAEKKGVLLVHAAGNSAQNNDKSNNFPNPVYEDTREVCSTWIEVGASGQSTSELVASFSNYGRKSVDIFAPGVQIKSTVPGNGYKSNSGTSMAAPVVSGVAALLMAYFPELSAKDVREIIVNSYTDLGKMKVTVPGTNKQKPFKKLSRTGGVVNAYNAVKMAESR